MPVRSRSTDKRERILAAAVKVFAAKGFYCARVSDVAREAGVADGTIYLYFESKEDLLRGLYEENMGKINEGVREIVDGDGPVLQKVSQFFEAWARFALDDPDLAEVLTVEIRESGKYMNEFAAPLFGEFLRHLVSLIDEGQAAGEFRTDVSPKTVARAMFGAMDELALAWVMSKRKWNLMGAGSEVLKIFLLGLKNPQLATSD
ncbi:MAG TPA: TetR/AcrR family transcriptional regulator [Myxococcales bacterium]|nr:TetR/AcrR family transcriptional regulator [Myxococcales bacterium]HIN85782.1 TetR/AcrR family transcriptional regulator [Myxococcales bacterium]